MWFTTYEDWSAFESKWRDLVDIRVARRREVVEALREITDRFPILIDSNVGLTWQCGGKCNNGRISTSFSPVSCRRQLVESA